MMNLIDLSPPALRRFVRRSGMRFLLGVTALLLLSMTAAAGVSDDTTGQDAEARAHAHMALEPPDWDAARAAFVEAAEQGSSSAMSYLGWMYEEGHGVVRDAEQAAQWYGRAARAGAHDFAVKLGWMYLGGDGVDQDREQAEFWFSRAVQAGHGPGKIAWASVLIADAQGGRDPERVFEARALLEEALEDGLVLASYFLARLYIEGIGDHPVEDVPAARYTRIGAESGHARMQGWLALMYLEGRGVEQDLVTAAQWASLAAANGDTMGDQVRLALEERLSPEELRKARERAVDWALQQR
ncbi:tetratricopeptide repeat protein [Thioalkalivibrio sp.]|uniref:tetratricopeptide repeat protein n=1 Tax=Thioalkalivibrio sp. TaxID=2093813 RepID=UPI0039765A34